MATAALWLGWTGWHAWVPVSHGPGVLVPGDPEQTPLDRAADISLPGGFSLRPLANYRVQARVLSKCRYRWSKDAEIAPWDFALGWGPMSDSAVLEKLNISQDGRFYHWTCRDFPIPKEDIIEHSANVHLIPANDRVRGLLDDVREGEVVDLSGYLVEATHPAMSRPWTSSLIRHDYGAGACEILYVRSVRVK